MYGTFRLKRETWHNKIKTPTPTDVKSLICDQGRSHTNSELILNKYTVKFKKYNMIYHTTKQKHKHWDALVLFLMMHLKSTVI